MGKGEIACNEEKSFENTVGKGEIARNEERSLENTVEKGEIACNEQFLLFLQCFLPVWRTFCHFHQNGNCRLKNSISLEESKICHLGKG